ncbi:MAG: isoprenylcysteine carboxylmethyltransferase family protein [Pseudomonadota bacterium]
MKTRTEDAPTATRWIALVYGAGCHGTFALAGLAMIWGLWHGMSATWGNVPWPWAVVTNALLLVQFPLGHSLFLTRRGQRWLAALAPAPYGKTLATTTYAWIASLQLLLLFTLWTPSGVILWQAEGPWLYLFGALFATSWVLLTKASFDAGPDVQSGLLGWWALFRNRLPVFPDMPETGLFRWVRQPIYVSFALTLCSVPIWTPDQLALAVTYTLYCLLAPRLKERRFLRFYGDRFRAYQARVPYWLPRAPKKHPHG